MRPLRPLRVFLAVTDVGFLAYWAITLSHVALLLLYSLAFFGPVMRAWASIASATSAPPTR